MMGRDLTNTTRKTRRREPAGFKTSSTSRRELIPQLCSRFAANEFDHEITRAGDVERFAEHAAPFIVFHDVPKQDKHFCPSTFRRLSFDFPHLFDQVISRFALAPSQNR